MSPTDIMPQLDSTEAVRYVWYGWHFIGIHPFRTHKKLYKVYSVFVTVCVTFFSPVQLILGAFFVESFGHLMRNMSTSIELICCSLKTAVVFALRSRILESHNYLKELDQRADLNPDDRRRMGRIVVSCKRIFIIYKILFWLTLGFYAVVGALTGKLVFDGWLPFEWKSSRKRYIIAFSYQWINSCYQCIMNLTTDVYSVLYAYVMLGHLKCISRRISEIGYDNGARTTQENYRALIQCIDDHRNALKFFDCLTPVISGTIFVQFLLTAFVLCMTAICVLLFKDDLTFLATTFCYLIAVTGEVLPCCYLVNEISDVSNKLTTSVYSCNWMDQDAKFRKAVIIFMQRSQKPISIMAGNLIPISLATFMSLIRISFSLFTLLTSV